MICSLFREFAKITKIPNIGNFLVFVFEFFTVKDMKSNCTEIVCCDFAISYHLRYLYCN